MSSIFFSRVIINASTAVLPPLVSSFNACCLWLNEPVNLESPMFGNRLSQTCLSCSGECTACFSGDNSSCYSCGEGYFLEYLKPECKTFCGNANTFKSD